MRAERVTTQFTLLTGDLLIADCEPMIDRTQTYVIAHQGSHWIFTGEELIGYFRTLERFDRISELTARYRPARVWVGGPEDPMEFRTVIMDGGVVTGVIAEGPLEFPDFQAAPPAPPPAADRPPTRSIDFPTATPSAPPAPPPAADRPPTRSIDFPLDEPSDAPRPTRGLGPTRGIDEPRSGNGEPQNEEEPWNLETRFPREVSVGSVTSLTVEMTKEAGSGTDLSILPVSLTVGTKVGVVVQAKRGFVVVGQSEGTVEASETALPLRFQLEATEEGAGQIRVLFFVDATALGAITLEPAIVAAGAPADDAPIPSSQVVSEMSIGTGRPDLELLVLEESGTDRPTYSIRVTATDEALGLNLREFGPIELHTDARSFFAELFSGIEGLPLASADERAAAQVWLASKGDSLFQTLVPELLRGVLWEIRDRITRIRIDSEEPYIPWELIRLSGPGADGNIEEGRFLCEYETTRWLPGMGLHSKLTLEDFAVVVPEDSGLASAQEERAFIRGLASDERSITDVPPSFMELMAAFAEGVHDVWHFSGHGAVKDDQDPNRFAIQLADGQRFTPEEIAGTRANLGKADPLVFLNACQVGQAGMSLTGMGGWANRFLDAGAAGFVGAMWNVHDNPARDFAKRFYTNLLDGDTIGAAALAARQEIKEYQDATWLAYTVYGHPSAAMISKGA